MKAGRNARAWLALTMVEGVGRRGAVELVRRLGSAQEVMAGRRRELCQLDLRPGLTGAIAAFSQWQEVDAELARIGAAGATLVSLHDPGYPELLKQIADPPPWLIIRGSAQLEAPAIAVVGARRASPYGIRVARELASGLAEAGLTVISGLALGIDGAAHRGALSVGGKTVAVLGSGIDVIYPNQHRELAERVCRDGALVCELPMGTPPRAINFPSRNRIIAGLSMGVVVVEAAERSGSLITAGFALEQGRDVFAVPGRVDSPLSRGTNWLIREGAVLTGSVSDIVSQVEPLLANSVRSSHFCDRLPLQDPVLRLFEAGPLSIDEFMEATGLEPSRASAKLVELELKGLLVRLSGERFERRG